PPDNTYHRKVASSASTGSTPSTSSTPSTGSTAAEEGRAAVERSGGVDLVDLVEPVEPVEPVEADEGFFAPDQTAGGLIHGSELIEAEALAHARTLLEEAARTRVLACAEVQGWRSLQVDGWARGGGAFSWKKIAEGAGLQKLWTILAAMQHAGWQGG